VSAPFGAATDWAGRLRLRAVVPPLRPRELLYALGGAATIGSLEPALAQRIAGAGLPLARHHDGWCVGGTPDPSLAAIARFLDAEGFASRWRDELLAVTDADDRPVAAIERAAVRPLGITTHAVHLVGHTADGRVWVQQRALDKATDPGLWDTLMGGLVAARESIAETLARETWEEAGLDVDALHEIAAHGRVTVRRPVANGYMVEHIDIFTARVPEPQEPRNQDGEVVRFECLDLDALAARLRDDAFTLEAALVLLHALPALR
jgi:8-oxo-dGTP pyrophosphatase MutT (NUDIX family)